MISIILIEPELSENVGFVARAMKNFDFKDLILINPKCELDKAEKTAKHGKDIIKKAKIRKVAYIKKFDYLIGTTAILGTDYNVLRNVINPEQLSEKLDKVNKKLKIALLIGRESSGLSNKELEMCDILITIPASKKYPTLNISHASSIILYELFKNKKNKSDEHINFATKKEKEIILKYLDKILNRLEFKTKEKKQTQKKVWKRVIGKALLTKREAFSVMGFFRKLLKN
ncbi:RNA methyltransferase [Candidatus Woesearchaeota archaeon]|nr:RNA methyltransferase [Candidatus Woesearchaeota archaeon]